MRLAALMLLLLGSSYGVVTQVSILDVEEDTTTTDEGSGKMIEFMTTQLYIYSKTSNDIFQLVYCTTTAFHRWPMSNLHFFCKLDQSTDMYPVYPLYESILMLNALVTL